jgi:3-oxoacyl-[acyl-carrier-protein] synthase-3
MQHYARIVGWGKYVPTKILTNQDLEQMIDTSDEWIIARTGIRERHIAEEQEHTSTMCVAAARQALEKAGVAPTELDLILVATSSPDYLLPAVSSIVQDSLGADEVGAFTIGAGCTGFIYALITAHQFIATGARKNVLVIGAELISRFIDWTDRETCVLFGDGAGAVVLQRSDQPTGVLSFVMGSDGSGAEYLISRAGGTRFPISRKVLDERLQYLRMDGRKVFKFASRVMSQTTLDVISRSGLTMSDIALIIPHQANLRILQMAAHQLGVPEEKMFVNVDRYGNTSAASIPIALCEALEQGRIKEGDNIVLVGFGAGLTWAAAVVQWGLRPSRVCTCGAGPGETAERAGELYALPLAWHLAPIRQRLAMRAAKACQGLRQLALEASALLLPLCTLSQKKSRSPREQEQETSVHESDTPAC